MTEKRMVIFHHLKLWDKQIQIVMNGYDTIFSPQEEHRHGSEQEASNHQQIPPGKHFLHLLKSFLFILLQEHNYLFSALIRRPFSQTSV